MQLAILSLILTSFLHAASGAPTSHEVDRKSYAAPSAAAEQKSVRSAAACQPAGFGLRRLIFAGAPSNKVPYDLAREDLAQTPFAADILEGDEFDDAFRQAKTPLQKIALSPSIAAKELRKLYTAVWREITTPDIPGKTWADCTNAIAQSVDGMPREIAAIVSEYAHTKPIQTIFENVVASEVRGWSEMENTQEKIWKEFFPELQHPVEHPGSFRNQFSKAALVWPLSLHLLEKCPGWHPTSPIRWPISHPNDGCLYAVVCPSCLEKGKPLLESHFGCVTSLFYSWKQTQFYHRPECKLYAQNQRPLYPFAMNDKAHLQNALLRLDIFVYEIIEKTHLTSDWATLANIPKAAVRWAVHYRKLNTLLILIPKCALIRDNAEQFWDQEAQRATQTLQSTYSPSTRVLNFGYSCYVDLQK